MRALALLVVASTLLAGCTSDGYLGEIDEGDQAAQQEQRLSSYWERAAASHTGDLGVSARTLEISGDGLAPIELASATFVVTSGPSEPFGRAPLAPPLFALAGATVEGERGWLTFESIPSPRLAGGSAPIRFANVTVRTDSAHLGARTIASGPALVGVQPDALANFTASSVRGVELPASIELYATNATFYGENGGSRTLDAASIDTRSATLVTLVASTTPFAEVTIDAPLAREDVPTAWRGNLTLRATLPSGTQRLASGEQLLAPYNEASFTMRGGGTFALREGAEWTFEQNGAEFVDVQAGAPRLEATLRLAPEQFNATGPAGNTTRVKLILAETSLGAIAHITGYRIEGDVNARYVGWEPFAISNELLRVMQETEGPIAPAVLLTLGVAVPIVAFGEAFAAAFQTLFPPSLAGTIGPGEARVLTFDLEMPDAARDVEILIESRNAEPVRATLRLTPIA